MIKIGDFYADCRHHPVVCTAVFPEEDVLIGVDLLTGSLGECSLVYCGVAPLTPEQAVDRRLNFAAYVKQTGIEAFEADLDGWNPHTPLPKRTPLAVDSGENLTYQPTVSHSRVGASPAQDMEEATAAYKLVIESGHPDQAPKAAFNLNLLRKAGRDA
jgi:hypothetical protein